LLSLHTCTDTCLKAWAVATLLRSPTFHRGVEKVVKGVHRVRHGTPMEEMGGTKMDGPTGPTQFLKHFREELKEQLGVKDQVQKQLGRKDQKTP